MVVGTAPEAPLKKDGPEKFTFRGEPKPSALVPNVPPESEAVSAD